MANSARRRAVVIGASVGGLVAAAQLRADGWDVTLLEKGRAVGGLFSAVDTPFGRCELGMHVLYVSAQQQALLARLFGAEAFIVKQGIEVDIGASFNRGRLNLDSIYPDVQGTPACEQALAAGSAPAFESLRRQVVAPILEKLWKRPAQDLAPGAQHCFFDLRRLIVADKASTDALKRDPALDALIGNPLQSAPAGAVFGGRRALFFRSDAHDLSDQAIARLRGQGIAVELGADVQLQGDTLVFQGRPLNERFEACIVASPLPALDVSLARGLDQIELSIQYFKIRPFKLPAYYVLCHDGELASSRIVNYGAYNFENQPHLDEVLAVESLHEIDRPPGPERIAAELLQVLPGLEILDSHVLPRRLKIAGPTLANAARLDARVAGLRAGAGFRALHFVGMRTDRGVFFSHQTIGAAHAAALDCSQRLA